MTGQLTIKLCHAGSPSPAQQEALIMAARAILADGTATVAIQASAKDEQHMRAAMAEARAALDMPETHSGMANYTDADVIRELLRHARMKAVQP